MFNASLQSLSFNLTSGGCRSGWNSEKLPTRPIRQSDRAVILRSALHSLNMGRAAPCLAYCCVISPKQSPLPSAHQTAWSWTWGWSGLILWLWSTLLRCCTWMLKQETTDAMLGDFMTYSAIFRSSPRYSFRKGSLEAVIFCVPIYTPKQDLDLGSNWAEPRGFTLNCEWFIPFKKCLNVGRKLCWS